MVIYMTKIMTDYEKEKQDKKQKLVRNEFLYNRQSTGKYEFPIIKKQNINVDEIKFLSFMDAKQDDKDNYDEPFKSMSGDIVEFLPTTYEWTKKLNLQDQLRFRWEKKNRNVSGLSKKDFKFFDYEDPLVKDQQCKCSICEKIAMHDEWGNGECLNCGWKFSKEEEEFEKKFGISYPMLVSPTTARNQYKSGKPFKATFDEFVYGLKFYSEMTLKYKNKNYGVFFYRNKKHIDSFKEMDGDIVFFEDKRPESVQKFNSVSQFKAKANINGCLLKDIWNDVSFAGFMYCG